MKYICLAYFDKGKFEAMTEGEQHAMFDTCFEYDDHLRANGHWAGREALQPAETAMTLYWKNGKVATTDGPYTETKEQLGGILVLEARDMNQAVQLIAQHPALTYGNFRDSASRGHERNHQGKRAAAAAEHGVLKTVLLCHRRKPRAVRRGHGANCQLVFTADAISLGAPEITLGGLHGNVPKKKLNLLQFRAAGAA